MKTDHATLAQAEGQLHAQINALHRERTALAAEAAKHENAAQVALDELQRYQLQLQEAKDTITILEKRIAVMAKPSNIPKPQVNVDRVEKSEVGSGSLDQARRSQTQLLRARSKNNNPPTRPTQVTSHPPLT
jgi:hypothetical protein